jgi:hypothetical protein
VARRSREVLGRGGAGGSFTYRCSETIHDSNAEKRREVERPPKTLPIKRIGMEGMCSMRLIIICERARDCEFGMRGGGRPQEHRTGCNQIYAPRCRHKFPEKYQKSQKIRIQ